MLSTNTNPWRMDRVRTSLIRQVFDKKRPTSLNLGLGQPSENVPSEILEEGLKRFKNGDMGYTANAGLMSLREKIAAHHRLPFAQNAQNVIVTCGAQEAIVAAMATCFNIGDEVIVPDPGFPGYAMAAEFLGAKVVTAERFEHENFGLNIESIKCKLTPRTRLVVLNSPGNPTGTCDAAQELIALAALAEKHDFFILCDEIYADINFAAQPVASATQFSNRAILVSGLSKNVAMTGFRLGYVVAPNILAPMLIRAHAVLTSCAPTLSQHMAEYVFENPHWLSVHCDLYKDRRNNALCALNAHLPGFSHTKPEGAFYILLNCSPLGIDSLSLALSIVEHCDVLTAPGLAFGDSAKQWLRLSFAGTPEQFTEGVARIGQWTRSL